MQVKVEITDGIYGHYEIVDTEVWGYSDDEIPLGEFDNLNDVDSFLIGWQEGLAQSDNAPYWAYTTERPCRIIVSKVDA